jgi:hypothetical protein
MASRAEKWAEEKLRELNAAFESDAEYVEALEELIDRAETMLTAKNEELNKEQGDA